jgi:ribosomal protein L27
MTVVYITKYALTKGIQTYSTDNKNVVKISFTETHKRVNDEYVSAGNTICKIRTTEHSFMGQDVYIGNQWHTDKTKALEQAEIMKEKKLISLNKQINKIKQLKFK